MRNNEFDNDEVFRNTLTQIAAALGPGWRWAGNFEDGHPNRSIIREDGAGIVCHVKWNEEPGVMRFHVIWPRNPNGGEIIRPREAYGTNAETWEIRCNVTKRGYEAVAKDLHRRLLGRYLPKYAEQLNKLKEWETEQNRRDALAEEIAEDMNVMVRRDKYSRNEPPKVSIEYDTHPGLRDYTVIVHQNDYMTLSATITDPTLLAAIWSTILLYWEKNQTQKAS